MSEKIYVGSGVEKFDGDLVEISVCLSKLPKEFMFEYNDKKYIKLKVSKKRKEDAGKTPRFRPGLLTDKNGRWHVCRL